MIGGTIIGLRWLADKIQVMVAECPHRPRHDFLEEGCPHPDTCYVYTTGILADGRRAPLAVGDQIWWQCGNCYWTPKYNAKPPNHCGIDYDIVLKKVGYSHRGSDPAG